MKVLRLDPAEEVALPRMQKSGAMTVERTNMLVPRQCNDRRSRDRPAGTERAARSYRYGNSLYIRRTLPRWGIGVYDSNESNTVLSISGLLQSVNLLVYCPSARLLLSVSPLGLQTVTESRKDRNGDLIVDVN